MKVDELSTSFDTLLNSYDSIIPPGLEASKREIVLDEFEKSLFLTKAQEEIIVRLYRGESIQDGFESTEEIRRYLEPLVKTAKVVANSFILNASDAITPQSILIKLPDDLLFITYEQVIYSKERDNCVDGYRATVVPVTQDAFSRVIDNPFKGPTKRRVLRVDRGDVDVDNNNKEHDTVELIPHKDYANVISTYLFKYLSKPYPIILENFSDDSVEINGEKTKTPDNKLILKDNLYKVILDRAVQLAIQAKSLAKEQS